MPQYVYRISKIQCGFKCEWFLLSEFPERLTTTEINWIYFYPCESNVKPNPFWITDKRNKLKNKNVESMEQTNFFLMYLVVSLQIKYFAIVSFCCCSFIKRQFITTSNQTYSLFFFSVFRNVNFLGTWFYNLIYAFTLPLQFNMSFELFLICINVWSGSFRNGMFFLYLGSTVLMAANTFKMKENI